MTMVVRGLCLLILITGSSLAAKCGARAWPGTFSLPSYDEGLPDPNPPFDQLATNRFNYPYTLRTHLTERRRNHDWRAVFLENEYLKCTILPDLGGHLYTCLGKINGQPMFYANPSIKKANIGYRGAWAAFGIEYNFPVSHNWATISPIDYSFAQHADGSASVTVGNTDRVYGMQWSVEMRLRPNSTLLEQRVTLANPSDVRHRFYWWNNAAVEVWDDSQIQYPMRFAASHGFREVQSWPIDSSGRDLSIIRNQTNGPVSLFAHGSREPFDGFGIRIPTLAPCTMLSMTACRGKRFGPGARTRMRSHGAKRCRTTIAPTSSCKAGFFAIRKLTPSLSHGKRFVFPSTGCR
jgi:Domain of unknown function (DUF5107)